MARNSSRLKKFLGRHAPFRECSKQKERGEETPAAEQPFASIELITLDRSRRGPSVAVGWLVGYMKA